MGRIIELFHSTHKSNVESILKNGLRASSKFDSFGLDMRKGVVYCWLKKEHDKMWANNGDYVYLKVLVDEDRCRVADMEWISFAMTYRLGTLKPKNEEAARLFAEIYRVTSVSISEYYEGLFYTPEVLVKGDISADNISLSDT